MNIWKVVGLNSTDVLHSSLAAEDGKVWMKISLVSPDLQYDFLSALAFIGLKEDVWKHQNYREEKKNLSTSPLQSQLSFCRAPVMTQMALIQWCGKNAVTIPSLGPVKATKSSVAQSPTLRVLNLVRMRSSSLEEPLKKWMVFLFKWAKDKSKYCVSYSHMSNERCVAYCASTDMKISLNKALIAR